jgi:ABC-2 type transport system permease protein
MVFINKIYIFASNDVFWRFLSAYGFAYLSLSMVCTLAYTLSSLVENAIGPIIATLAIIIVFSILSVLPFEVLSSFKPYFFITYLDDWKLFFTDPVDYSTVIRSAIIIISHIIVLYLLTLFLFLKKDILT